MNNESYKETQIVPNDNIQFCRHCGKKIEADSTFCKYCGKKIKTSDVENDNHSLTVFSIFWGKMKFFLEKIKIPKNKFKVNKRKLKRIGIISLIVVGSLILLGGISGLIYYYFDKVKPQNEGKKIYAAEMQEMNSLQEEELLKKCKDIIHYHNVPETGKDWIDGENLRNLSNEAWKRIEKLAEDGNDKAQFFLATKYAGYDYLTYQDWYLGTDYNGYYYNHDIDFEKAAYWYEQAASQGNSSAQNNLGNLYEEGSGVPRNIEKAIYWYECAAKNGNDYGQLNLGDCYRDGIKVKSGSHKETIKTTDYGWHDGEKIREYYDYATMEFVKVYRIDVEDYRTVIPRDIEQAKYWWNKAAAQGNMQAKERLQKIY